jgi:hypothetical protein
MQRIVMMTYGARPSVPYHSLYPGYAECGGTPPDMATEGMEHIGQILQR